MYKNKISKLLMATLIAPGLLLSSCESDDPVPEVPLEEYNGLSIKFIEVELHGDHHHDLDNPDSAEIKFVYEDGKIVTEGEDHVHLHAGATYLTEITIWDEGQNINADFEPETHQFFLTGAPEGILEYEYGDKDMDGKGVGFEGYLTVNEATEVGFDLKLALIHYSQAGTKPDIAWNDPDYASKIADVGHHDFEASFECHPVEGDHAHEDEHVE